jgi:glycosyltransferase involved in cell wall biosynthesis
MPKVVHIVTTPSFAGVERYVANVASETAARHWEVAVVGGDETAMTRALARPVRWLPGSTPLQALRSLARIGRCDVCHAHMTLAEAVAAAGRPLHHAPIVATRHFASPRGSTPLGRAIAPWVARRLARQLAVSEFVARSIERPPDAVVLSGVAPGPSRWRPESRVVLVLQRLEPEKDSLTALQAWRASALADDGWTLRIAGDGSERSRLERWAAENDVNGVAFAGWTDDVPGELDRAGMVLAPCPIDSFGLAVVEAMVAGVPVVASSGGGHLETIGRVVDAPLYPSGDAMAAADALRSLADTDVRRALSIAERAFALEALTIGRHVDQLLQEYAIASPKT